MDPYKCVVDKGCPKTVAERIWLDAYVELKESDIKIKVEKEVIDFLKGRGIPAYIETILGLPEESLQSFKEGLSYRVDRCFTFFKKCNIFAMKMVP